MTSLAEVITTGPQVIEAGSYRQETYRAVALLYRVFGFWQGF